MTVDTAKVPGRRKLKFESLEAVLEEAERLAAAPRMKALGNWSPGQVFHHLAATMNLSIDGHKHRPPWFIRWLGPVMRNGILKKGMSPGFKLPQPIASILISEGDVETAAGLAVLREAVRRLKREAHREPHGFFGKLTHQQWDQLHLRHAELHLSFLVPEE